jgi:hypothetical protein
MTSRFRLALALAVAIASGAALAQPKPALVQDRDEPGRDPYLETVLQTLDDAHCFSPGLPRTKCWATFSPVPAGKRLVVTYVAVWAYYAAAGTPPIAYVANGIAPAMLLPAMTVTSPPVYQIGTPTTMFFNPSQVPTIHVEAQNLDPNATIYATIAGYFVTLP